uniref:DUF4802 domain-containing protein n=1 Tax=Megaselia scalaris TaxID=36166 RepID=T1GC09_MEGSC
RFFKTNGVHSNKSNSSKSSNELYQEAVEILGLTCTLCDNCRCLDCQSRYFECDDSDLFMGDCYEYSVASDEQDDDIEECSFYKYSIQQSENCNSNSMSFRSSDGNSSNNILATSHIATTNISLPKKIYCMVTVWECAIKESNTMKAYSFRMMKTRRTTKKKRLKFLELLFRK